MWTCYRNDFKVLNLKVDKYLKQKVKRGYNAVTEIVFFKMFIQAMNAVNNNILTDHFYISEHQLHVMYCTHDFPYDGNTCFLSKILQSDWSITFFE